MPVTLGFGLHYLFGGIFAMTGALWRGPIVGLATVVIASLPTRDLLAAPMVVIFTALEVVMIGLAARRRVESYVTVDLLFWLLLGLPLLLGIQIGILRAPLEATVVVALKFAVNSLFNVAVGSLLLLGLERMEAGREHRLPLHIFVSRMITPLVLVPVLLSTLTTARQIEELLQTKIRTDVVQTRKIAGSILRDWMSSHRGAVEYIARTAERGMMEPEALDDLLMATVQQHRGFLGVALGDRSGTVQTYHLARPYDIQVGDSLGERPYFPELLRTQRGGVSDAFPGTGGEPLVVITEPVMSDGEMVGFALGALTLDDGNQVLERLKRALNTQVVVTDQLDQVIFSTRTDLLPLAHFDDAHTAGGRSLGDGVVLTTEAGSSALQVAQTATMVSRGALEEYGWRVYVIRPLTDVQRTIYQSYMRDLAVGLAAIAALLLLIPRILRGVTHALSRLAMIRVGPDGSVIHPPLLKPSRIEEIHRLQSHLDEIGQHLSAANRRLVYQAEHDSLTDLRNAGTFWRDLERRIRIQEPFTLMMIDLDGFKRFNDLQGHLAGDQYLQWLAGQVQGLIQGQGGQLYRYGGDEFAAILPVISPESERDLALDLTRAAQAVPARAGKESIFLPGISLGYATYPSDGARADVLVKRADTAMYGNKQRERIGPRWFQQVVQLLPGHPDPERLARLEPLLTYLHDKLPWLHEHSVRLARMAVRVGAEMGLSQPDLRQLEVGALLHDLGKVEVPSAVLTKEGELSDAEYHVLQQHAAWGAQFLLAITGDEEVAEIALAHHERYDGQGYPHGLSAEAIPIMARIVAVIDAYDAMTNQRPYAPGAVEEARAELLARAGSQFDPRVVAALIRVVQMEEAQRAGPGSAKE